MSSTLPPLFLFTPQVGY
ncbi:hypothetical protein JL09_g6696 [Pichia kudriavzevii]|uniref:Uncharacterized protein n=1 Tax=Pichia kudriavzevii TaxID=4909 RepID=A0A099NL73_PICKU|nr:hypothetical protein JL09_g6696 [Pichia kudriavzevii]